MVEPLAMKESPSGAYVVNGDLDKILPIVRQAVELGADIIKADPTDDTSDYHHVITIAGGVPVLVRGGGKAPEEELLQRTYELLQQGAAGLVYGRNIVQHDNPVGMTRALMALLHDGVDAAAALKILRSS
jgi:DhnA family fructose-bisphosphate aldolase class Ia